MRENPLLDFETVLTVVSASIRWKILKVVCDGELIGPQDLAPLVGCTPSAASKHLRVLLDAGICVQGRGGLYRLAPQFLPAAGTFTLDFGYCQLHLERQPAS
jgi:hypothetical protein